MPAQTCSVPGRCCGPPNWLRSVRLSRRPMERSGTRTKVRKGWGTGVAFVPFPRPAANSPVTQGGPRKDANVRRGRSVSRTRRDHTRLGQGQCFLVVASGKQLGFLLTVFFPTCPRTSKQSPPPFLGTKSPEPPPQPAAPLQHVRTYLCRPRSGIPSALMPGVRGGGISSTRGAAGIFEYPTGVTGVTGVGCIGGLEGLAASRRVVSRGRQGIVSTAGFRGCKRTCAYTCMYESVCMCVCV